MPFLRQQDWRSSALARVLFMAAVVVSAVPGLLGAGSDIPLPSDDDRVLPPLERSLSQKGKDKADALTEYALGYAKLRSGGNFSDEVMERLLETVKKDPGAITPLKLLFARWTITKKPEKLVEALLPIAKKNPTAIDLNVMVANSLRLLKKNDEAIELLEASADACDLGGGSKKPLKKRAALARIILDLYAAEKRWNDGEDFCDDLLDDDDAAKSYAARLLAARFLSKCADQGPDGFFSGWSKRRRRRSLEENLKILDGLAAEKDYRAKALSPLVEIYERYKMPERAERLILSRLVAHPRDFRALVLLAKTYDDFEMYALAARTWRVAATGADNPRAVLILRDMLKDPAAEQWLFKYREGLSSLEAGWFDRAVEAFNRCLLLSPGNPAATLQIAYAYMRQGKNLRALKTFSRIEEIPSARYLKGVCLSRIGKNAEAFDTMAKAEAEYAKLEKKLSPPKEFWLEYAIIADRAGKKAKEEEILVKLHENSPDDPDVNNFLGYIWADWNKNLDKAEELIKKALEKEPDNVAYLDSMGWVLFRKGKLDEAFDYVEKAIEKDSPVPDAVILDHAGDIKAAQGDKKAALKFWKQALETYNEDLDREATKAKIADAESEGNAKGEN